MRKHFVDAWLPLLALSLAVSACASASGPDEPTAQPAREDSSTTAPNESTAKLNSTKVGDYVIQTITAPDGTLNTTLFKKGQIAGRSTVRPSLEGQMLVAGEPPHPIHFALKPTKSTGATNIQLLGILRSARRPPS